MDEEIPLRGLTLKEETMTDADGNYIPLVEDDQGEGIKDFVDEECSGTQGESVKDPIGLIQQRLHEQLITNQVDNSKDRNITLNEILEKLEKLDRRLDHIFGTHVLVGGRWEMIKPL